MALKAMTIDCRLQLLAIWICWSGLVGSAQGPPKRFHWDWRKSEEPTWIDSISRSKTFSAEDRAGLIEEFASQFRPFMSKMGIKSEQELEEIIAKTRIKAVDLGGSSFKEFAALSGDDQSCSPTGNCEFWILQQDAGKYSVILHRIATQTFTIQPTISNGFHDLVLGQHGSATETGLTLYCFDGSKYRRVACYDASWRSLGKDGEYHDLKEPRIVPTTCLIP